MIGQSEASALARSHVEEIGPGLILLNVPIAQGEYGWVFGYQSEQFIRTGNSSDMLAGNAPLLVEKETGRLHVLGTAFPVERYVASFVKYGDPHRSDDGD